MTDIEQLYKTLDYREEKIRELEQKNKGLQKDSQRLKKVEMQLDDAMKMYATIKAEAIREVVYRLCEDRVANDPVVIAAKCLLKEMVGDDNGITK